VVQVSRSERRIGTQCEGRTELAILVQFLRPGDTLVITHIDRLARDLKDYQGIVHERQAKGVTRVAEQPVDTCTSTGRMFFDMLGVFAEFETSLRRERQTEGVWPPQSGGLHRAQALD
jgi:DNA invertase Pin-like site-specific DNA recombinase